MAEHAATRLVQHEVAQGLVTGDEARLLPHCIARRRGHATDDDITDFAFCVTADNMDDFGAAHDFPRKIAFAIFLDNQM